MTFSPFKLYGNLGPKRFQTVVPYFKCVNSQNKVEKDPNSTIRVK